MQDSRVGEEYWINERLQAVVGADEGGYTLRLQGFNTMDEKPSLNHKVSKKDLRDFTIWLDGLHVDWENRLGPKV